MQIESYVLTTRTLKNNLKYKQKYNSSMFVVRYKNRLGLFSLVKNILMLLKSFY